MDRFRCDVPQSPPQSQPVIMISPTSSGEDDFIHSPMTDNTFNNNYYFYNDVTPESASKLSRDIASMNYMAIGYREAYNFTGGFIRLHINSFGGDVFSGLGLADAILNSELPVYTYVEGCAASAATLFSVVGNTRFIGKNSFMLIHQISNIFWGNVDKLTEELENSNKIMDVIKNIYLKHTKFPKDKLEDLLKKDIWLSADECLEYGLVDQII